MRDLGFHLSHFPAVLGSDVSGTIVSTGSSVSPDLFKPGTRVAAFAPCFYTEGIPQYGAFQTHVLVPSANTVSLPEDMTFSQASLLPMAVGTALSGWYSIGLSRDTLYTAADKQGVLVWSGASSVGSAAVQSARLMGYTVYATASPKHHEYVRSLGASHVFDYKDEEVVGKIVKAAKEDDVTLSTGYLASGDLQLCEDVLKEFIGQGPAKIASAPPLSDQSPMTEGVEVKFVLPPLDQQERTDHSRWIFNVWLKEKLESGEFVPSPEIKVIGSGLESVNQGLDELKKGGVSGQKLVIEV